MSPPVGVFAMNRYGRRHRGWPSRKNGPRSPDMVRKMRRVGAAIAATTNHFETPVRPGGGASKSSGISVVSSVCGGAIAVTRRGYSDARVGTGELVEVHSIQLTVHSRNEKVQVRTVNCEPSTVSCQLLLVDPRPCQGTSNADARLVSSRRRCTGREGTTNTTVCRT
jgi:hypothetical protein